MECSWAIFINFLPVVLCLTASLFYQGVRDHFEEKGRDEKTWLLQNFCFHAPGIKHDIIDNCLKERQKICRKDREKQGDLLYILVVILFEGPARDLISAAIDGGLPGSFVGCPFGGVMFVLIRRTSQSYAFE